MMNTNLLDLNIDILNIIGGYVKKDNIERKESFEKVDILYNILNRIGQVKRQKPIMRTLIANYFYLLNIKDFGIIDEYLTLKKLNLKNKKYSFGKNCIKQKNIIYNLKLFNDFIDDCKKTIQYAYTIFNVY